MQCAIFSVIRLTVIYSYLQYMDIKENKVYNSQIMFKKHVLYLEYTFANFLSEGKRKAGLNISRNLISSWM